MSAPDDERPVFFDDDQDVLPDTTGDERGDGWGEATGGEDTSRLEELIRDRPPHWG